MSDTGDGPRRNPGDDSGTDRQSSDGDSADEGPRIRALDQQTIQRIAAGEVVERPASVVKEFVENSLDAGADRVSVEVENGGMDGVTVRDDGHGMTEQEARLAVQEHTTSKITDIADLERGVSTLGFRGEALHTIGAVSRLTIRTKARGSDGAGTELRVEGGEVQSVGPVGCPDGTTIEVEDLFYNTPARRKFLKTRATEFDHVNTVVTHYALANPEVAVSLTHDGREVFATEGRGSLESTVLSVYGREVAEAMTVVDFEGEDGDDSPVESVTGLVSHPETTRSARDYLSTFVNDRYVTASTLREGVLDAYGGQLAPDRYPFAVLFVDVPRASVDVNVHPRKMEVRFDDEERVQRSVERAVREALLEAGLVRSGAPRGRSAPGETVVQPELSESGETRDSDRAENASGHDVTGGRAATDDVSTAERQESSSGQKAQSPGGDHQQSATARGASESSAETVDDDGTVGRDETVDDEVTDTDDEERSTFRGTTDRRETTAEPSAAERAETTDSTPVSDDAWDVAESWSSTSAGPSSPSTSPPSTSSSTAPSPSSPPTDRRTPPTDDERNEPDTPASSDDGRHGERADDTKGGESPGKETERVTDWPRRDALRAFAGVSEQRTLDGERARLEPDFDRLPSMRVLGQVFDTYLVAESGDGLVLIDQHAADERVNYERLRREVADGGPAQALASPVELELTAREAALFDEHSEALASVGFEADRTGDRTVAVTSVPAVVDTTLDPGLLRDALTAFVRDGDGARETVDDVVDELLADLACYPSITGNTSLREGSVLDLLSALDDCENPYACPHGRPVVIEVDRDEIEDRFERDYPGHAGRRRES